MERIDAHVHFWRLARGGYGALDASMAPIFRDREPPHLEASLQATGVARIIIVQAVESLAENLYTLGLAARFPWIAGVVGWVDPASPSAEEAIDRLIERIFAFAGLDASAATVQRRIATTSALALARLQRDPALSPTIALALWERLARLAATLSRGTDDWSRGLGRLLGDREALTAALADQRRLPHIPPGMPIGGEGEDWPGL